MNVELKNVRELTGEETPEFEATVYIDGKRAALVNNRGCGGPCEWHWLVPSLAKTFHDYAVAQLPADIEPEDGLVYALLDAREEERWRRRTCRSKTVCRIPGKSYTEGEWSIFKVPFSAEVKAKLTAKYGTGIRFLNEEI